MRLGEGTGAALAMSLAETSVRILNRNGHFCGSRGFGERRINVGITGRTAVSHHPAREA